MNGVKGESISIFFVKWKNRVCFFQDVSGLVIAFDIKANA